MENKKNKRKLFKRIGAIVCAVAVAVVAFLVPYFGKNDSKKNIASATAQTIAPILLNNFRLFFLFSINTNLLFIQ